MRLLFVDDDENVREAITAVLRLEGFDVVPLCRAKEFIEYVESGESFDAALIDVTLPDMTGWELRSWLAEAGHSQPAIICSGKPKPDSMPDPFLQKPFPSSALITLLRSLAGDDG